LLDECNSVSEEHLRECKVSSDDREKTVFVIS